MGAMEKLDRNEKMPKVTIDAVDLGNIPRSYPEDLNNVSIAERLIRMKAKMSSFQDILDHTICENLTIKEQLDKKLYSQSVIEPRKTNAVPPKSVKSAASETRMGYSESTKRNHPKVSHLREKSADRLIQEHWLLQEQLSLFETKIKGIRVHDVSGMDSNRLLCGRPFRGCTILWKSGLLCNIKPIVSESRRVCAVMIEMGYMKVLLCNVYMPCANSNEHEFDDTLNEIGKLIYESDTDYIVVGGDFNTDLSRTTSYHTIRLKAFCSSYTLDFAQKHDTSNVEYTFESKINGDKSTPLF
ncbi:hypothetical protein LOTGIDRAFT_175012 [Lottia gigantea]|uniref:Endonuclease/exonuclease/phosphatase domain-containing protein n=1 Tax=Lottia gigantea TaxID=225164 RepID=V4AQK5_LOTGI|nr:hypothetical protein LOTGIDRAFT_175012 [Lottia gigantea]ESO95956.1 hypothetical protein LOTGIDRAFT_175012 [Lottia gigantea]